MLSGYTCFIRAKKRIKLGDLSCCSAERCIEMMRSRSTNKSVPMFPYSKIFASASNSGSTALLDHVFRSSIKARVQTRLNRLPKVFTES